MNPVHAVNFLYVLEILMPIETENVEAGQVENQISITIPANTTVSMSLVQL